MHRSVDAYVPKRSRGLNSRVQKLMAGTSTICVILWTVYFWSATIHTFIGFGFLREIAEMDGDYQLAAELNDRQSFPSNVPLIWIQNTLVLALSRLFRSFNH